MKVQVDKVAVTTEEIDVKFPLYIVGNFSAAAYTSYTYYRITEDGLSFEVRKSQRLNTTKELLSYEFEIDEIDLKRDLANLIDPESKYYSAITKKQYSDVVKEAKAFIKNFE